MIPRQKTSLVGPRVEILPSTCSGLMYPGVPFTEPSMVLLSSTPEKLPVTDFSSSSLPSSRPRPQSMTRISPNRPTMMLSGFRSRCMTSRSWA